MVAAAKDPAIPPPTGPKERRAFWRRHYSAWRTTSASRKQYAHDQGLAAWAVYDWFRRFDREDAGIPAPHPIARQSATSQAMAPQPVIVPVTLIDEGGGAAEAAPYRLHIPGGLGLDIPMEFTETSLARLLDCLGVRRC
jgi:hypothetical protein